MPSCEASPTCERILGLVGIVERRPLDAVHHSQLRVRLVVLFPRRLQRGFVEAGGCASSNVSISCVSQNSALRTLPW